MLLVAGICGDIVKWCIACSVCATRHMGRAVKPPSTPIPVTGPFDRVVADVIKYVKSMTGNQYAVVLLSHKVA